MSKNFCYEKLVKHHRELGVPWTDPAFPPSDADASFGAAKVRQLGRKVEWKRPSVSASLRMEGNNMTAKVGKDLSQCTQTDSCIKP